jgi:hypothetical protein
MRNSFLDKKFGFLVVMLLILAASCKRTQIDIVPDPPPTPGVIVPVNDAPQVTASVSGIVLDESNAPIVSAVVTSGTATTTTNSNGMFILNNISLSKENGSVTVVKAGYFKGIRSFKTTAGKNHSVRLQMMARVLSGTVNAAAGGTITSNGGATIIFPAAAFVTNAGAAYTGTVNVYSRWIDPTAANLPFIIPGDLRGISTNGVENILETYGMVGAELTDASGNTLKIATGKTATVSFPIPASLTASAPASIVLWHFDDASARWKENGTATKTGSTYTAQVDKFSFWNCDVGITNFINLDYTLINATTNTPLVSTSTRIKRVSNGRYGYGVTNNAGFVSGLVPKNEALVLEVVATSGCNTVAYSQNIGPFTANTSLGNINITIPSSQYISFTGTLLNCSAAPVSNGYISLYATGGGGAYATTNAAGAFSFSILNCSGTNITYNYQGTDNTTSQQSSVLAGNTSNGAVNLGNVNACGAPATFNVYVAGQTANEGVTVWKNNIATILTGGIGYSGYSVFVSGNDVYVTGNGYVGGQYVGAKLWKNGVPINLTNGLWPAAGFSVFVSNTDVYVVGLEYLDAFGSRVAKLWKNGIATSLSTSISEATSVFVTGTDVYIAGLEYNATFIAVAKIWKNGVATNLTNGTQIAGASSVYVAGTDVYVAGREKNAAGYFVAKYWKNGIATSLTNGGSDANANSIYIVGNDVYVAGNETDLTSFNTVAKLWKNGVGTSLGNGIQMSSGNSVFVLNSDVYVAGNENSSTGILVAKIWKNNLPINLSDGSSFANASSIYVK